MLTTCHDVVFSCGADRKDWSRGQTKTVRSKKMVPEHKDDGDGKKKWDLTEVTSHDETGSALKKKKKLRITCSMDP